MTLDKTASLKVGIVGCGNIANLQLRYIKKYIKPENIALCDKNPLRMNWLSEEHRLSNTFPDLANMIEVFKPTVVHVLTPPKSHKDIAVQCIKAGCHVFLEKPMCVSVQEAHEIVDTADSHNRLVCIDHLRLFDPHLLKAKRIVKSGILGDIVSISTREVENYITRKKQGLTAKWMEDLPGEIFYDILPHHLSIINAFLPGLSVKGVEYKSDGNGTPKELVCILSSGQGSGMIHLSLVGHLENYDRIECTKGVVIADFLNRMTVVRKSTLLPGTIDRIRVKISEVLQLVRGTTNLLVKRPDNLAGMDAVIGRFYEAVAKGNSSPVPPTDGLVVTRVIEDIFGDTPSGEREFGVKERDTAYTASKSCRPARRCDVLVTGGTGFIGRRLVGRLLAKGRSVRVLTHREYLESELWASHPDRVEVYKGNISNPIDVERACSGVSRVYHLAAATKGPWLYHLDTTVAGTQNIVDACSKYCAESLVYISTIGILNTTEVGRRNLIDEDVSYEQKAANRGIYAKAKLMAELIVRRFMDEPGNRTKVSILRPGIVYGPGKYPLSGIAQTISQGVSISLEYKKRILPLVYVDNLLDAIELAGNSNESGIYNVVDSGQATTKEFVNTFKKETGKDFRTIFLPRPILWSLFWLFDRASMVLRGKPSFWVYNLKAKGYQQQYSTNRIASRLGWVSKIGMEEALRQSIDEISQVTN